MAFNHSFFGVLRSGAQSSFELSPSIEALCAEFETPNMESSLTAGGSHAFDVATVRPSSQRVGVDAADSAGFGDADHAIVIRHCFFTA